MGYLVNDRAYSIKETAGRFLTEAEPTEEDCVADATGVTILIAADTVHVTELSRS